MTKAIFLDYTGTMVREDEPYTRELLAYFIAHSDVKDPSKVLEIVWEMIKKLEAESFGDSFIRNDEKVDRILAYCVENHGLSGDLDHMHSIWRKIWVEAPLYDDVRPFFERVSLPVYVLSNDDLKFLEESMSKKGLHPAGIISAEMAKACKPNRAIFEKALEVAGVQPSEAVLIGDSITSDIEPAGKMGITPILIDRTGKSTAEGVTIIHSLVKQGSVPWFTS